MKLLLMLGGVLGLGVLGLPLLVVAVMATHPWLVAGALTSPAEVVMPMPRPEPAAAVALGLAALGDALEVARSWLGVPYAFGGCSRRGVDWYCLVQLVYRAVGVNLPAAEMNGMVADDGQR